LGNASDSVCLTTRIRQTRSMDCCIVVNDGMVSRPSGHPERLGIKRTRHGSNAWWTNWAVSTPTLSLGDFRSLSPRLRKKTSGV
jgi:hypothetical protein